MEPNALTRLRRVAGKQTTILTHYGRKTGKPHEVYGRESEWVRNVIAAGASQLETRGVQCRLSAPTIVHDPTRRRLPIPVQIVLRLSASGFRVSSD
jgi:hypothetical protein